MKFNCGPSLSERLEARYRRNRQWHRWYAWRPVRITGTTECVWLEYVHRKNIGPACVDGWDEIEYRE